MPLPSAAETEDILCRDTLTPHISARTLRDDSIAHIAGKLPALEAGAALSSLAGVVNLNQGY